MINQQFPLKVFSPETYWYDKDECWARAQSFNHRRHATWKRNYQAKVNRRKNIKLVKNFNLDKFYLDYLVVAD